MKTEADLAKFIAKKAEEHWKNHQSPYLLSLISTDLNNVKADYKSIIGEERLKAFAKRHEGEKSFRVVEHPVQKAKVGVIPPNIDFHFEATERPTTPQGTVPEVRSERAVANFLAALSELPEDMQNSVIIPTGVLVRMMSKK